MRFIDVEGQLVADIIFYDPPNLKNLSSTINTVDFNKTWRITTGHTYYSKFGDRMATITDPNCVRYGVEGPHSCHLT